MQFLLLGLAGLAGIVSLVCWIMVLIKMFSESVVQGIIGIICGLWAFIWGWQHKGDGLDTVMPIWTVAFIVSFALRLVMIFTVQ